MENKELEDELIAEYIVAKAEFEREEYVTQYKEKLKFTVDLEALEKSRATYLSLSERLNSLKERGATQVRHGNLIRQLRKIHDNLKLDSYGNRIDRNQGLSLENYIYADIIKDLASSIKNRYAVCSVPHYKYSIESDFDHEPLKELLHSYINELNVTTFKSYVDLLKWFEQIEEKIASFGKEEYLENRDKRNGS